MTTIKPTTYTLTYKVKGETVTEQVTGLTQATDRATFIAVHLSDGFVNAVNEEGESAFHIEA